MPRSELPPAERKSAGICGVWLISIYNQTFLESLALLISFFLLKLHLLLLSISESLVCTLEKLKLFKYLPERLLSDQNGCTARIKFRKFLFVSKKISEKLSFFSVSFSLPFKLPVYLSLSHFFFISPYPFSGFILPLSVSFFPYRKIQLPASHRLHNCASSRTTWPSIWKLPE